MEKNLQISGTKAQLDQQVAGWLAQLAIGSTGQFRIALSGGTTPQSMYQLLAKEPLRSLFPWSRVHWYWGDERFVPYGDRASNYGMAWKEFLSRAPVPEGHIHFIPTDGTPESAASRYEAVLKRAYGCDRLDPKRPLFDVNLMGIGADGHTASLLPGTAVLGERERWVVPVLHGRPEPRITLTYPVLESSRYVAFMVSGVKKAEALKRALHNDRPTASRPPIVLVMGVSGSGKTTIGKMLAERLDWPFKEGDDFHPQANIDKMHAGAPLNDEDRQPWLAAIAGWIDQQVAKNQPSIITCSALKRSYRDFLRDGRPQIMLVYLRASPEVLAQRLSHRRGHFMPASLLDSQLDTLEAPTPDENPLVVDDDAPPKTVVEDVIKLLNPENL